MNRLARIQQSFTKATMPKFEVGDTVRVHVEVVEGEKERIQVCHTAPRQARLRRVAADKACGGCRCSRVLRACVPLGSGGAWVRHSGSPADCQPNSIIVSLDARVKHSGMTVEQHLFRKIPVNVLGGSPAV